MTAEDVDEDHDQDPDPDHPQEELNIVQNRFNSGYDELASDIRAPSQQGESSGTWTRCRVPGQAHYSPTADLRHHPSRVRRQPGYPAVGRVMPATAAETASCPRPGPARPARPARGRGTDRR